MGCLLPPVTNPAPSPQASSAEEAPDTWQLRMLQRMAEAGMSLVEDLCAPPPEDQPRDPTATALAFSRLTRAVRQILALHAEFEKDGLASLLEREARRAEQQHVRDSRASDRIDDLHEAMEIAHRHHHGAEPSERLFDDVSQLLAEIGTEALADRPVSAIVEQLCAELGFPFDPALWLDEDWAGQEKWERTPGSPYAMRRDQWPRRWPAAGTAHAPDSS